MAMSEIDEVAQAIYDQHPEYFPLRNREQAMNIARGQMPEESFSMQDLLADALLEIKPCKQH